MENQKVLYTITIKQERHENTIKPRDWVENGTEDKSDGGEWGYAPQITEVKAIERTVYTQVVEDLNLGAVIAAVNEFIKS